jgi:hypothetical protein
MYDPISVARPKHFIDLAGQRFGRLLVIEYKGTSPTRHDLWLCMCDCRKESIVTSSNLRSGTTSSCGCYHLERQRTIPRTHGQSNPKTRAYRSWASMKARCQNPKVQKYPLYGGRGITICAPWIAFENFYADMGECPEGMTLERKDSNGNYEPGNVRWASVLEQSRNRRSSKYVIHNGQRLALKDYATIMGIKYTTAYKQLRDNRLTAG